MTDEQKAALLAMLKIDLGITATAYDERLEQYLEFAAKEIAEEGATLDFTSVQDNQLIVMYAAWTWRRRDDGAGMPRMIRYALNNRVLAEKMRGEDG